MSSHVAPPSPLHALSSKVRDFAERSRVPFSDEPRAAGLLLTDGQWVPGVRVESASFSLVIPALLNALTTAVACDAPAPGVDISGVALSHPARPDEKALLNLLPNVPLHQTSETTFARPGEDFPSEIRSPLDPYLDANINEDAPRSAVQSVRRLASRARTPLSDFPVACLLQTPSGMMPGVNVEYEDWTRTLCAERNALGTAITYASGAASALYLSCPHAPQSTTPCGACRQLLLELAPHATVWMDRREDEPQAASPSDLLPGGFTGRFLSSD